MNVVVFIAYAINTPHFETELEIIQNHLDRGDSVTVVACERDLKACDVNSGKDLFTCLTCVGRLKAGLGLLTERVRVEYIGRLASEKHPGAEALRYTFSSVEELKKYRVANFDIGYSVVSSLVSLCRDPDIDLEKHKLLVSNLLESSWAVFNTFTRYLETHEVDRVYVYNGRYAPLRAVLRACQGRGVECMTHEKGHDLQHYALFENTFPHDLDYIESRIRAAWAAAGEGSDREEVARRWYEGRARGVDRTWISFVAQQNADLLPGDWDSGRRNVAIFSSSEDEFVAIGDNWKNPLYKTQLEALRALIQSLRADPGDLHLYLRIHPNLTNVSNHQIKELNELRAPFLTVIKADDPVSTYSLMKKVDKVVTFGSSTGIEAVYWGTPSILAGSCFYKNLGATYNASSHEELVNLIRSPLNPKDNTPALMYGYYFATFGLPFKYYVAEDIYHGEFKGRRIKPRLIERSRIKYIKFFRYVRRRAAVRAGLRQLKHVCTGN